VWKRKAEKYEEFLHKRVVVLLEKEVVRCSELYAFVSGKNVGMVVGEGIEQYFLK